jgi:hypothetical protein
VIAQRCYALGMKLLDWLFPIRVEARAEADELMEAYGNQAYFVARRLMIDALTRRDSRSHRLYSLARKHIAKRTDFEDRVDTATRLLEATPYELVRPRGETLH